MLNIQPQHKADELAISLVSYKGTPYTLKPSKSQ